MIVRWANKIFQLIVTKKNLMIVDRDMWCLIVSFDDFGQNKKILFQSTLRFLEHLSKLEILSVDDEPYQPRVIFNDEMCILAKELDFEVPAGRSIFRIKYAEKFDPSTVPYAIWRDPIGESSIQH